MEHLFLSCPWTSSIWSHPLVRNSISFRGVHRIEKWLLDLLDNKEGLLVLETTASILWQIWKARNNSVFRQQRSNSEQVVQVALANVQSDRRYNGKKQNQSSQISAETQRWQPPEKGVIKINIDASYLSAITGASVACVCRNSSGFLIDGFTRTVNASSALQAEVLAFSLTLQFLLQQGKAKDRLVLESDCAVLVEALLHPDLTPWESRALFHDCASLLLRFPNLQIQFCRREANSVADRAAKAHGASLLSSDWLSSPPSFLLDLMYSDMMWNGSSIFR
ncbi:uncharacterized protein LOC120289904 [Eucalyptus grandis]|uniref:uncharacterized protein LOC120289904 n=1 Tax=Eucalyptus grandis TaxID=71139 RepID=UPI00192E8455|nr:uncharacterized protein LOC120289904 [Eucalyptus grandis]